MGLGPAEPVAGSGRADAGRAPRDADGSGRRGARVGVGARVRRQHIARRPQTSSPTVRRSDPRGGCVRGDRLAHARGSPACPRARRAVTPGAVVATGVSRRATAARPRPIDCQPRDQYGGISSLPRPFPICRLRSVQSGEPLSCRRKRSLGDPGGREGGRLARTGASRLSRPAKLAHGRSCRRTGILFIRRLLHRCARVDRQSTTYAWPSVRHRATPLLRPRTRNLVSSFPPRGVMGKCARVNRGG